LNFKYKKLVPVALGLHVLAVALIAYLAQGEAALEPPADAPAEPLPAAAADAPSLPTLPLLSESPAAGPLPQAPPFEYAGAVDPGDLNLPYAEDAAACLLVDLQTRRALVARDAREPVPIASLTKMMTALLAFEDIELREDLSLQTPIRVTEAAYRIGGSQVWLDPRETFSLGELLVSIMVKSANDSAYLVAERLGGGDVDAFVERMNRRAAALGMPEATFRNPHGLPLEKGGNFATSEGLALLAAALLEHPKAVEWARLPVFQFRADSGKPTRLDNHNRLVVTVPGVDGMKTGYTRRAGFCIAATCLREGRRLVAVAAGFPSAAKRDAFVEALLDWGYERIDRDARLTSR